MAAAEEYAVTDGDDLIQTGERGIEEQRDYLYPLPTFVPTLDRLPEDAVPDKAARWIVPDLNNVIIVSMVKVMSTTFLPKVPASYNELFIRVDRNNRVNPTPLQRDIWESVTGIKYRGANGLATVQQMYLLPVIRYAGPSKEGKIGIAGEWVPCIAELSTLAYRALKKEHARLDDATDGIASLATRPVVLWKIRNEKGATDCRIETKEKTIREEVMKVHGDSLPNPREYLKVRAKATEEFFRQAYENSREGGGGVVGEVGAQERYIDAVTTLTTPQLRGLLGDKTGSRQALIDAAIERREELEKQVLLLSTPDE